MKTLWVLGTGGTIAGARRAGQVEGQYTAGVVPVDDLLSGMPQPAGWRVQTEQRVSMDSKDMRWSVWQALAASLDGALSRAEVGGVVITHGTDTLEETACVLDWLHDQHRPIVLTAAMRPATAMDADGPRNLQDAMDVTARLSEAGVGGVWVCMHGQLWPAACVRKVHSVEIDAFDGGGTHPVAHIGSDGIWQPTHEDWASLSLRPAQGALWSWFATQPRPRVECVFSHADADGWVVKAMLQAAQGGALQGLVVAGTGHGTVHETLGQVLDAAMEQGVVVWRSTRVPRGGVSSQASSRWPATGWLTPAQARVALSLQLLGAAGRDHVLDYFNSLIGSRFMVR